MKNKKKAWIAGAAGAVLLMGAGGTFAVWTDSARIVDGVVTGHLAVAADSLHWTETTSEHDIGEALTSFPIVPGDVLEGTGTVSTTLVGLNLRGELRVTGGDAMPEPLTAQVQLAGADPSGVVQVGASGDVPITVTITFPEGSTEHNGNVPLSLGDLEVVLTQVRPAS
jgi:alternate signal-mediated exported protein